MTRDVEQALTCSESDGGTAMTEQESRLKALVEAADDIEAGRTWTAEEFKPRLALLKARARRIGGAEQVIQVGASGKLR